MKSALDLTCQLRQNYVPAVCWVDKDAQILSANTSFIDLVASTDKDIATRVLTDFFSTNSCKDWNENYRKVTAGELVFDKSVLKVGNKILHADVCFSVLSDQQNKVVCLVITRVSESLLNFDESELLKQITEDAQIGVMLNDEEGNICFANNAACTLLGYTREELQKINVEHIDADHTLAELRTKIKKLRDQEGDVVLKTRHSRKDGSCYPAHVHLNPTQNKFQGYTYCSFRDVSDSAEQEARQEWMSFLVENANDAIYVFDEKLQIIYVNERFCRHTGYSREELLGMNISQLDPACPSASQGDYLEKARQGQRIFFETEHITKSGSRVSVEVSLAYSIYQGQVYINACARNISDRKAYMSEMEELKFALENASDAIYLYDQKGAIHYANQSACDVLGYAKMELTQMNISELDSIFAEIEHASLWDDPGGGSTSPLLSQHLKKDGSYYPVEIVVSASRHGNKKYAVAFVRDISDRIKVEQALEEGEERFRIISDTSPVALIISRVSDGTIQYANKQAEFLFDKTVDELHSMHLVELFDESGVETSVINSVITGQDVVNREMMLVWGDVSMWVSLNTRTIELQGESVMCCAMLDVTEAKELSNQLSYHATYDDLTGLVNRREFEDRLQEVIEIAHKRKTENALCYLDLDQFKIINDTCGHMAGDELLRQIAQVLYGCVRHDDTLARLGGDEFAILLEHCSLENAEIVANKARQQIQDFRFVWQGKTFTLSVSIGLVTIAKDGETISDVLRRADTACYAAKDAGRNRIHVFKLDDADLVQRHGEMQWVSRISLAMDQGRLELWQQSIMPTNSISEDIKHYELLLRMRDEEGKLILPGAFLPAAERYDLASRIDRWVVDEAFRWFSVNQKHVDNLTCCSINLSGQTLSDAEFLSSLTRKFQFSNIPADKVCFEITETAAITNMANATQFMKTLSNLGCAFALDDFGSGLSSFAYLKNLPVDYVKIDGFFVKDVTTDPVDLAMVKAINDMAHAMNKLTIAEFVEDEEILKVLLELGVDFVQGYGIAKPQPLKE